MPKLNLAHNKLGFWFYAICLGFIGFTSFMIAQEKYWAILIPFGLWVIYLCAFSMDWMFIFITLSVPLSVLYESPNLGVSFTLPTEPILFGVMLIFWAKVLVEGKINARGIRHPITVMILLHMLWMLFTTLTSSIPLVSAKFFLSNLWYITVFYFLGIEIFKKKANINQFLWVYAIPLVIVVLYTLYRHRIEGWSQKGAGWVMEPFFINHGVYGASLALLIPFLCIISFRSPLFTNKPLIGLLSFGVFSLFVVGLIFSYTRAAWLGVAGALGFYIALQFRIRFWVLLTSVAIVTTIFLVFQTTIVMELNRNKTDSDTDFRNHLKSISNVKTDASNMERINRWACGYRMFKEKPMLGWGPGTYQFNYAPFQKPNEKTIISTNMHDAGGIHSEYLGPLIESGVIGFVLFIGMVLTMIYYGMQSYYLNSIPFNKMVSLGALLGLITYVIHGFLNNYLDLDKTASLFWAFAGLITAMNLKRNEVQADYSGKD